MAARKKTLTLLLVTAMAVFLAFGAQIAEGERQLKAAVNGELVNGDLKASIKQYSQIAARFKTDRAVVAMALVHMAECYQKLGDAEARQIYGQVLKDYGDQKEAVTLARAHLGTNTAPKNTGKVSREVWTGPKVCDCGTVSPDGRYISSADPDTDDLTLHEIATKADQGLTANKPDSPDDADESVISRDGKQIAYAWYNGEEKRAELRIGNLTGELNAKAIYYASDVSWIIPYDWSPDGRTIAVQIARRDKSRDIGVIAVPEGTLRVLKHVDPRGTGRIFFSPDGNYLGYDLPENDTSPDRDVFILPLEGTKEIEATHHRGEDLMMGWTRDGKGGQWLLFGSDRNGSMDLFGQPFAEGKTQGNPVRLHENLGWVQPMGVTAAGALYYAVGSKLFGSPSRIQLGTFDFSAGRFVSAPADFAQDPDRSYANPFWSPDGAYLAYNSLSLRLPADAQYPVVEIRSLVTGEIRRLPVHLQSLDLNGWAVDGQSLLAHGLDYKGHSGTYQIDARAGDVAPVVPDQPAGTRSPDGKKLYYRKQVSGSRDIAFVERDLQSGVDREIIRRVFLGNPKLTPDGRYLTTGSLDQATNSRLSLGIPVDGSQPIELMRRPAEVDPMKNLGAADGLRVSGMNPPDSKSIIIRRGFADKTRSDEMWQVWFEGIPPRQLDFTMDRSIVSMSTRPDGKQISQIAIEVLDTAPAVLYLGSGNNLARQRPVVVMVLENFLPAATK